MPRAVAVVDDLLFTVKMLDAAKRAGLSIEFVKSRTDALDQARQAPALMIVDLNFSAVGPLALIAELKRDESLRRVPLIAYVSHVQADLKQAAQRAGCDQVMPRSAFSLNLRRIFELHAASPARTPD